MAKGLNLRDSYNRILKFITKGLRQVDGPLRVYGTFEVSETAVITKSLNYKRPVLELATPATTTHVLTGDDSGVVILINDAYASNLTITLPADTSANIGFHCSIFIGVTQTGTTKIATAADGDQLYGSISSLRNSLNRAQIFPAANADDNVTLSADTNGRVAGSFFHFTILGTNKILVDGVIVASGNPTDPFTTS